MITLDDYFQGRREKYPDDMTPQILEHAQETVDKVNALLAMFREPREVTSGWRPPEINAALPNSAQYSKHMDGQACDLADPHGDLDEWLLENPQVLRKIGLWQEHPSATKGWCHVQTVPPRSGKLVFYP